MSPQTIKFLTFLQPNYITSIVEIIFLILIYKKLKEINNKRWTYGKIYRSHKNWNPSNIKSRPRIYKTLLTWKNPSFVKKIW